MSNTEHETIENPKDMDGKSQEYVERTANKHATATATLATDVRVLSDRDNGDEKAAMNINEFADDGDGGYTEKQNEEDESLHFDADTGSPNKDDSKFRWNPHLNPNAPVSPGTIEDSMEIHLLNGNSSKRNIP